MKPLYILSAARHGGHVKGAGRRENATHVAHIAGRLIFHEYKLDQEEEEEEEGVKSAHCSRAGRMKTVFHF